VFTERRDSVRAMKHLCLTVLLLSVSACGGANQQIEDLPLVWTGEKSPSASTAVDKAFAAGPIELGQLSDGRQGDRAAVGSYADDGFRVKTKDDVHAFWANRLRVILEGAGAKLGSPAPARFDASLLEFDCVEGNTYNATVRMNVTVTRQDGSPPWSKTYEGRAKRWGRSHSAENFNEALTKALAEATRRLLQDEEFATAVVGQPQVRTAAAALQR
jgi:Uncharacterized lipoprotein